MVLSGRSKAPLALKRVRLLDLNIIKNYLKLTSLTGASDVLLLGSDTGLSLRRDGVLNSHHLNAYLTHLTHLSLAWFRATSTVALSTVVGQVRDWSTSPLLLLVVHLVDLALRQIENALRCHHWCSLVHALNLDQALHVSSSSLPVDAQTLHP
jgi:hypothetical protein